MGTIILGDCMQDRGMKKWRPFNAVVPGYELKKKETIIPLPDLLEDELIEFEEALKASLYTHTLIKITFIEDNTIKEITDYVIKLDPIRKDVILKKQKINFRQIVKIQY